MNNFTAIPGTLRDNTFENVGEVAKGLMQMDKSAAPAVGAGAVFSGVDPNARSYLRFHNTGTAYGHVGVRVYDQLGTTWWLYMGAVGALAGVTMMFQVSDRRTVPPPPVADPATAPATD